MTHATTRKPLSIIAIPIAALLLAACAGAPKPVPAPETVQKPAAPAAAAAAEKPKAAAPVAPVLSEAQRDQLDKVLGMKISNAFLRKTIEEAKPNLAEFLGRNACINDGNGSVLDTLAAPGVSFPASGYNAPMAAMASHDQKTCVGVTSLQKITAITIRHLRLETVYQSSSGEHLTVRHELQKQPDGEWLFLR
ncbi:MAG: hypothetical protein CGU28_14265 [Candidatus Dactylopiibacterium carminicum]|nr:hypothetical protein [Candidatus Dactylopiibacterium carminicum]PAS91756.1 MAG: hypothetical protein CGU29_14650 [Candidatus Dactylopiibacterium carminicum]PAS94127.1 MAG: hypothetical protein CGU28_14265 [Candidatus Dactylopiibacterium carminicum]